MVVKRMFLLVFLLLVALSMPAIQFVLVNHGGFKHYVPSIVEPLSLSWNVGHYQVTPQNMN